MTMMENKKLAIVIPVFNRKQITIDCLTNLAKNDFQDYKVFVSDSGSTDGTQEAVLKFEKVELIHAGTDAWWSAAVNQGVRKALIEGFELILILNDDVYFESTLISQLLRKHNKYPNCIISPIQQSPTGLYMGTMYSGAFKKLTNLTRTDFQDEDQAVDTTNGCCLLIPKIVFEKVGLFNEYKCPHFYGDTEFQLRAKHSGHTTISSANIVISQLAATDSFKKINLFNTLSFKGSPLNLNAYLTFGSTLFEEYYLFYIFGWSFHWGYIRTYIKAALFFLFKFLKYGCKSDGQYL